MTYLLRRYGIATLLGLFSASTALAQDSSQGDGLDFDTLAACSIIYQRVSELYIEGGSTDQGEQFQNTAHAYSASAYHMLKYQNDDQDQAYAYAEDRMKMIMESLNEASTASDNGDMDVVQSWLPYCDTLGDGINQILERREAEGW